MAITRVLLGSVACLGLAGLAQADAPRDDPDAVAAELERGKGPIKPWKHVRGFGRVLDLRSLPVVIDAPGHYAIDRNWKLPDSAADAFPELIQITADNVTLDLHGFAISADPGQGTLLAITGNFVEVRNGELTACCTDGAVAVQATKTVNLHHLSLYSYDHMEFAGAGTSLTDSQVGPRVGMSFANYSTVERNVINCNFSCVSISGDDNRVLNNTVFPWQGGVIDVFGDRNIVADNLVDATNAIDIDDPFVIAGDTNVVRNNTVVVGGSLRNVFAISGTANTLDGNIAAPPSPAGRAPVGMAFTADGNYYGDNRMAAQVPFSLGGTVQTDWGGNVGY